MSTDTNDTPERDVEAELAAAEGQVREALEAAGVPASAVEGKSFEELTAKAREVIGKAKARDEKGKAESQDLKQMLEGFKGEMRDWMASHDREGKESIRDEEVARKIEVSVEDEGEETPARRRETKSMLDRIVTGGVSFAPSVKCLLGDPLEHAADVCRVPERTVKAVRQVNDRIFIIASLLRQAGPSNLRDMPFPHIVKSLESYRLFMEEVERNSTLKTAMDTAESGAGADWIPTGFSAELQDRVEIEARVASLFSVIPMPTQNYEVPMRGARATAYLAAEQTAGTSQTAITASNAGTGSPQLQAKKLACRVLFSDELSEDSIIPIVPYVEAEVVHAIVHGEENAIVNGDTAGTHFDTGLTVAATDVRKAFLGLRASQDDQTPSTAEVDCSTFNSTNLLTVKKEMGKYGTNSADGAWICNATGWIKLLTLTETITQDKYGPLAAVHTGEVAKFFGSPVILTEHITDTMNASGVIDGCTGSTKTVILYVNRPSYLRGQRSATVESDRLVEYGQTQIVAINRKAFVARETVATALAVGAAINVS